MKITLIGLGTRKGDLTKRAENALKRASKIMARTGNAEAFKSLEGFEVETLDGLFMSSRNFDSLNKNLASAVIGAAKISDVCYCVDGAVCEDEACKIIMKRHDDTEIIEGVSKSAAAAAISRLESPQYTAVSAYDINTLKSCRAAVVYDIDCEFTASTVKQKLTKLFGEETECSFVRGEECVKIKIYEIDRLKSYDYSCAVAVEESGFLTKDRYDYDDVETLIKLLRAPDGCPWDRVQTNESIKSNVIEEAYELADAIERGDDDGIEEETGDVLLQSAFHSVLKEEQGVFDGSDAITRLVKKLIFRHSHIFGKDKARDSAEALGVWDKNKTVEKHQSTFSETLEAVPVNFPACMRAQKVQKRASKAGMDFSSTEAASAKLYEEVKELKEAISAGDNEEIFSEAGDVLFSAVNVCRLAGADCEDALKSAVKKFSDRFKECERLITADGKEMTALKEAELDKYWIKAKNAVKSN